MPEQEHQDSPNSSRLPEQERYNQETQTFPDVIHHHGAVYDLRGTKPGSENGLYRMMNENRVAREEPSYLEVDTVGNIIRAWD